MNKFKYNFSSADKELKVVLDREDINIFGYTLESDRIHLVYLLKNGDLIYSIFANGSWTTAQIGKFNIMSNFYKDIEVLYINGKINIFYSYANYINSNIFTLHHVIYKEKIEARYNIIRYISEKNESGFSVDYDSNGNIHLLYSTTINNSSYIYYSYFNPFNTRWLNNPIKMSQDEKHNKNPYIMVDSSNNIHAIYWEKSPITYSLKYHRRGSSGKDIYKWVEMSSLKILSPLPKGILIQNGEVLDLIYGEELNHSIISSLDFGLTWRNSDESSGYLSQTEDNKDIVDSDMEEEDHLVENTKDIERLRIDKLINSQEELKATVNDELEKFKILLENNLEELTLLKSKVMEIEEKGQNQSFFKKLFN